MKFSAKEKGPFGKGLPAKPGGDCPQGIPSIAKLAIEGCPVDFFVAGSKRRTRQWCGGPMALGYQPPVPLQPLRLRGQAVDNRLCIRVSIGRLPGYGSSTDGFPS